MGIDSLTITRPDDWHCHLRDNDGLAVTVPDIARYFGRAIVMPNLTPPVTSCDSAIAYLERISACIPMGSQFQPLMTLYLTNNTTPEEIIKAKASGQVYAAKLYPAGATTNSDAGVTDLNNVKDCLEEMQKQGLPLLIHGEVTEDSIDIFDREQAFIDKHLVGLTQDLPELKIVLEHITTKNAVDFVTAASNHVAATITAHHLLYNRNHMLVGGIKPHYYCLPILKRNTHQEALISAATSGNQKFFLGTDSAPHPQDKKEAACGCAGCYTALSAIELYAEVFEQASALDKLEAFASFYGPDFYGLPRNEDTITLNKKHWTLPESIPFLDGKLIPLRAGEELAWQVV